MDIELRKFYNDIITIVSTAKVPIEAKRITLELVAKQCELQANENISTQLQTITEKGEMEDGTINTGFTGVDEVSQCSKE